MYEHVTNLDYYQQGFKSMNMKERCATLSKYYIENHFIPYM